jgi:TP901 family phage tail tape measure protein
LPTTREIEAILKLKDELSAKVITINKSLTRLEKQTKRNHLSFAKLTGSWIAARAVTTALSRGIREIGQFLTGTVKSSTEFNDAFTKSTAIMGDLSNTMKSEMVEAARTVARETTFSAKETAEAYFFLASAGLDAVQSIGALPQVASFAQAGAFGLAQATDLLTDAQSALGLTIRDDAVKNMENMSRVSDVLVKANTLANASVEQFSQALTTKAGPALKILGKDIEEGVAVLAAFADQGVKAAEGGTALNIVLRDLSTKAIKNADAFRANNIAVFDSAGEMRNIADIISDLEDRLKGMSDESAKATLQQLGFADKSVIFIQTLIGMSDRIREYEEGLRKAGGITDEVANKQLKSFASIIKFDYAFRFLDSKS